MNEKPVSYAEPCPACEGKRRHTPWELDAYHPQAGGGFNKEQGWTANIPEDERGKV